MPNLLVIIAVWIIGFGLITFLGRKMIAWPFVHLSPLPKIINYFIILTPFVIVEEYLTCEIPFQQCIRFTIWGFWIMFLILFLIHRFAGVPAIMACVIFGAMGWVNEFIIWKRLFIYSPAEIVIASIVAFLIYFVLAIPPSYYLEEARKS